MKFLIKEKMFSLGNTFSIKDEFERERYRVKEVIFTLGKKLYIYDEYDEELLYIEQQYLKILEEYRFYKKDTYLGSIKKKLTIFKPEYDVYSIFGDYTIEGTILEWKFVIKRDGKIVAEIMKALFNWTDTYSVDIDDKEDVEFILGIVIMLDQIHHDYKN